MGGSGFSAEIFNAREQLNSSDLMRAQFLASRDLQNLLGDASADDSGTPITGFSGPCTLTAASGFTMALSAAQAMAYNPGDASLTIDSSPYEVARWALQNLTFATPDGANPRIDLVVVTPAVVSTDQQSRTVLVDPTTRAVTAQPVYKTANPTGTIAIVTGTPGATPAPPAVPAGAFAIWEVWVPAGAASSTSFTAVPRMFRRAPFPWSTMNAIIDGFRLTWDMTADPTTTASALSMSVLSRNRIIIDGEVIDGGLFSPGVSQDAGAANPFASAASSGWHKPYYIYAVGGRNAPQAALNQFGVPGPLALVESTTVPVVGGHPASPITTPRGTTTQRGAVFVGLGFVYAGTTRRLACIMDETWTWPGGGTILPLVNGMGHTAGSTSFEAFDGNAPAQVPIISRKAMVTVVGPTTAHPGTAVVTVDRGDGVAPAPAFSLSGTQGVISATSGSTAQGFQMGVLPLPTYTANPKIWVALGPGAASSAGIVFLAFEHRVRRIDPSTL